MEDSAVADHLKSTSLDDPSDVPVEYFDPLYTDTPLTLVQPFVLCSTQMR
jgi:hypothetical protein